MKPSILIIADDDDTSLGLFFSDYCQASMNVSSIGYDEAAAATNLSPEFIYLRDPFIKKDYNLKDIFSTVNTLLSKKMNAYVLDGLSDFSDMLIEDKWQQYELFSGLMPKTWLVESFQNIGQQDSLIKKRISARSRDVHLKVDELPEGAKAQDYIVQEKLDIKTEYRAFMVGSKLILPLEVKSGKTEAGKNKVIGVETEAPDAVKDICEKVYDKLEFDLMGLDIAETDSGFYLLEVNRSPQFATFYKFSSINLAETLIAYLLEKMA